MEKLKLIIAENIAALRKGAEMTQFDLAERLNYSDKAVSKWERGESVPDISVLKQIADIFSVSVDYLLEAEHTTKPKPRDVGGILRANRGFITAMSITLIWLIALIIFVTGDMFREYTHNHHWLVFLWAVPPTFILWLVLNSVWFNTRLNFLIISLLMWSTLSAIHISLVVLFSINVRLIYTLGIPGQIIILLWSRIKKMRKS
ncbi:MAG: helix-turn-helix transcriptional regulator [Oscillospiraceae bacterium]|nr:helix-turn-helix transcriptional regulator [Oscillospiraceae bacterium]MBQ4544032.1 helix-turn-helix transcriptional regulator [Oscillospiraceae bacterium]